MSANLEQTLPFPDALFNAVLFLDTLEHLRGRDQSLKEANRVLKAGGRLLLAIPNSQTTWKKRQEAVSISSFSDPDPKIEYTKQEIIDECQKHGFSIQSISPIVYDVWYVGFIDLIGGISLAAYKRINRWKYEYAQKHPEESIGFEIVALKS